MNEGSLFELESPDVRGKLTQPALVQLFQICVWLQLEDLLMNSAEAINQSCLHCALSTVKFGQIGACHHTGS